MVDDVKGKNRFRVNEAINILYGACYHAHLNRVYLSVNSADDCIGIKQALLNDELYYATEFTTLALLPNREKDYAPRIIAGSAGCLRNDPPERTKELIVMSINKLIRNDSGEKKLGCLTTIQPDGAAHFIEIGHDLFSIILWIADILYMNICQICRCSTFLPALHNRV